MLKEELSIEELSELELLEVRGGAATEPEAQTKCVNESVGCGAGGVVQVGCVNRVVGCTSVVPPPVQENTSCGSNP